MMNQLIAYKAVIAWFIAFVLAILLWIVARKLNLDLWFYYNKERNESCMQLHSSQKFESTRMIRMRHDPP